MAGAELGVAAIIDLGNVTLILNSLDAVCDDDGGCFSGFVDKDDGWLIWR